MPRCTIPGSRNKVRPSLLVEDGIVWAVVRADTHGGVSDDLAEEARLDVTLNDDNAVVVLQSGSDECSCLVQGEAARVAATSRRCLDEGERTSCLADRERDERVRGHCRVTAGVEARDSEQVLTARGHDDKSLIWLCIVSVVEFLSAARGMLLTDTTISADLVPAGTLPPGPWVLKSNSRVNSGASFDLYETLYPEMVFDSSLTV